MKKCVNCKGLLPGNDWRCPACGCLPATIDDIRRFAPEIDQANDGFKPEYFDDLFELESGNFWFKSRSRLIHFMIGKYFSHATNFLEIGCGTGYVLSQIEEKFPNLKLTGGEAISAGLHFAQQRTKKAELVQVDARALPYEDEFDLIGAFDVIEHIDEDERVLSQLYGATTRGGGLILTVPQHDWLWSYSDDYAQHKRRYSAEELRRKVSSAGYEVLHMTSFVSLLLPAMYLSRATNKESSKKADQTGELRLNRAVNYAFERIMDLERYLIQVGVPFGAGGSLMLAARKT
jgi:SAM-dependent methyltransferase